jgi:hypothetical protein
MHKEISISELAVTIYNAWIFHWKMSGIWDEDLTQDIRNISMI